MQGLIVTSAFGSHSVGDIISDAAEVSQTLAERPDAVNRVKLADPAVVPPAAPAAQPAPILTPPAQASSFSGVPMGKDESVKSDGPNS